MNFSVIISIVPSCMCDFSEYLFVPGPILGTQDISEQNKEFLPSWNLHVNEERDGSKE